MWDIRLKGRAVPLPSVLVRSSSKFVLQILLHFVLQNDGPGSVKKTWITPERV
jgi:hypothetical protein